LNTLVRFRVDRVVNHYAASTGASRIPIAMFRRRFVSGSPLNNLR
jgi:hypothetical protein